MKLYAFRTRSNLTLEFKDHYSIVPSTMINLKNFFKVNNLKEKGRNVVNSFEYSSGKNPQVLSISEIKKIVEKL